MATPLGWQLVGFLLLALITATTIFLFSTSYARTEIASGIITLDTGVAAILPSRAGVIEAVSVGEGQPVSAGTILVKVRSEEQMLGGSTAAERTRGALVEQDARLQAQGSFVGVAATAETARLRAQAGGLTAEIGSLDDQINDQSRLVELASSEFDELRQVAEKGFISRRDLQNREAVFVSRRQQLAQLRQSRASKHAQLLEAERAMVSGEAAAMAQIEAVRSGRAALEHQLAQAELSEGYAIRSPVDGIATGIIARPGQPAAPQTALMTIIPTGAVTMAELRVPTSAVGFMSAGQEVRLAVDAFPYQRFGTISGRIVSVSAATTTTSEGVGSGDAVYLVNVRLAQPWIIAFGRRERLLPGMALKARIMGERRSLVEWLLEPLFAVRGR